MLPLDNRRSTIQIAREILSLLRLGPMGKTEVMYAVKLSYAQTQKYLPRLVGVGLVQQSAVGSDPVQYRITDKGLRLLVEIENVQEMLRPTSEQQLKQMPPYRTEDGVYKRAFGQITRLFGKNKE